jgi:hypothetical protein
MGHGSSPTLRYAQRLGLVTDATKRGSQYSPALGGALGVQVGAGRVNPRNRPALGEGLRKRPHGCRTKSCSPTFTDITSISQDLNAETWAGWRKQLDLPVGRLGEKWSCCWSCCRTPSSGRRAQAQVGLGRGKDQSARKLHPLPVQGHWLLSRASPGTGQAQV